MTTNNYLQFPLIPYGVTMPHSSKMPIIDIQPGEVTLELLARVVEVQVGEVDLDLNSFSLPVGPPAPTRPTDGQLWPRGFK